MWMNIGIRGVLRWQLLAGLAGSVAIYLTLGVALALSLAYGALLTVFSSLFLAVRCQRAGGVDKTAGQRLLYSGAVMRFLGVLAALLLACGLGLHLLAVAGGMLLAQIALFAFAASHTGRLNSDGRDEAHCRGVVCGSTVGNAVNVGSKRIHKGE